MVKNKLLSIIFAIIFILFLIFCFIFSQNNNQESKQTVAIQGYIIGNYQEKIAVFAQGDKVPIEVYDVYISTLPEKDQKDINKGIIVSSKTKLRELIEDYTS